MSTNKKTLIDGDFQVGSNHLVVDKARELSEKSQITLLQNVVYSLTKRIEALENA